MYIGIGKTNPNDQDFTFNEDYDSISISITASDAVVKPSPDGITRVIYTSTGMAAVIEAQIKGNTLFVREKWNRVFISGFSLKNTSEIVIEVPEKVYDSLTLSLTSGEISVSQITSREFSVNCTSGSINIANASGKGNVKVTSGDVKISYDDWSDSLAASVTSGKVTFYLPEDAGINFVRRSVTSGSLNYQTSEISGENVQDVDVRITSGSVSFRTK